MIELLFLIQLVSSVIVQAEVLLIHNGDLMPYTTCHVQHAIEVLGHDSRVSFHNLLARTNSNRRASCKFGGRSICDEGWVCDEYPFASTDQGGIKASTQCVPRDPECSIQGSLVKSVKTTAELLGAAYVIVQWENLPSNCADLLAEGSTHEREYDYRAPRGEPSEEYEEEAISDVDMVQEDAIGFEPSSSGKTRSGWRP
jgi:hypothetical protein